MRVLSCKMIHLWSSKNFSLYTRLTPHAIKLTNRFVSYFHRYFRRLSKEFALFIPIFLLIVLALNLKIPKNSFDTLKENVQFSPNDPKIHEQLAQKFISANEYSFAEMELVAALKKDPSPQKRMDYAKKFEQVSTLKKQPNQIHAYILSWQQITNQYPFYRDGYLKLAILNWKLYRPFDASKFLAKAIEIDPNNIGLKKFEDSLK